MSLVTFLIPIVIHGFSFVMLLTEILRTLYFTKHHRKEPTELGQGVYPVIYLDRIFQSSGSDINSSKEGKLLKMFEERLCSVERADFVATLQTLTRKSCFSLVNSSLHIVYCKDAIYISHLVVMYSTPGGSFFVIHVMVFILLPFPRASSRSILRVCNFNNVNTFIWTNNSTSKVSGELLSIRCWTEAIT